MINNYLNLSKKRDKPSTVTKASQNSGNGDINTLNKSRTIVVTSGKGGVVNP